jgi:hypothetical protein
LAQRVVVQYGRVVQRALRVQLVSFAFVTFVTGPIGRDAIAGEGARPAPAIALTIDARAAAACVSDAAFFERLERQGARVVRAERGEEGATLRVAIEARDGGFAGSMELARPGAAKAVRRIEGATCEEVAEALSLMAAVALDSTADQPAPRAPSAPPAAPNDAVKAPAPAAARSSLAIGATLEGRQLASDRRSLVVAAFAEWAREENGWAPALRVGAAVSDEGYALGSGRGEFLWLTARIEACPLRAAIVGALFVRPCALVEGGLLRARGEGGVTDAASVTRPWIAVGPVARLSFDVASALRLDLSAGALTPLVRDEFVFAPNGRILAANAVIWSGALGASWRLP